MAKTALDTGSSGSSGSKSIDRVEQKGGSSELPDVKASTEATGSSIQDAQKAFGANDGAAQSTIDKNFGGANQFGEDFMKNSPNSVTDSQSKGSGESGQKSEIDPISGKGESGNKPDTRRQKP